MPKPQDWPAIHTAMREGGYLERLRAAGAPLARVLRYAESFGAPPSAAVPTDPPTDARLAPDYPLFPGLAHQPFHDPQTHPAVALLERAFATVRSEALALGEHAQLDYTIASAPLRHWSRPRSWLARRAAPRAWTVYPFFHMGVDIEAFSRRCPNTHTLLQSLPGLCVDYPWGDAVLSVQGPASRLRPHCSIDNLRLRAHLALKIPPGAGIRVGGETRSWQEGRCLLFEDSFEHEVWNPAPERRLVLIVDFWHPGLAPLEVRALTAGFRHSRVRRVFLAQRLRATDAPAPYLLHIESQLEEQDKEPLVREFWAD